MERILIHEGIEIANSYTIQAEEGFRIEKDKLVREVYFDAADCISLIKGIVDVYNIGLEKEQFSSPSILVHALAYNKLLGQIKLLPSHQDELITKFVKESYTFPSYYPHTKKEYIQEILHGLGLSDFDQYIRENTQIDYGRYAMKLKEKARGLYKVNYLLKTLFWTKRYQQLFNEKDAIISIDNSRTDIKHITAQKLFHVLREAFDITRESKPKNNVIDALAFYQLQEKLEAHKNDPSENPLPIFFVSNHATYKALRKVMMENDNNWFMYEHNGQKIPIVRDADFFILDAIFSTRNNIDDLALLLKKVMSIKETLRVEYDRYELFKTIFGKDEYKQFSEKINNVIDVEFFNQIWLERNNYQNLDDLIKSYLDYDEDANINVIKYIKREKDEIFKNISHNLSDRIQEVNLLNNCIEKLKNIKQFVKKRNLTVDKELDVFKDFSLIRFSIDGPTCKEKIETKVKGIIDDINNGEESNYKQKLIQIAASLVTSALHERTMDTLIDISVLWVFEQYELITEICKHFKEDYKYYQLALIHASSIFYSEEKRKSKVLDICKCIENKPEGKDNYKAFIGLSYVYYLVWNQLEGFPILLELLPNEKRNSLKNSKNFSLIVAARAHVENAYIWLCKNKSKDESKLTARNKKYYYSINNLLYFITKISDEKEFKGTFTQTLLNDLANAEEDSNYWLPRYNDTLALYYCRKAILSETEERFLNYLSVALKHNEFAINSVKGATRKKYERFNTAINEVRYNGFKKRTSN